MKKERITSICNCVCALLLLATLIMQFTPFEKKIWLSSPTMHGQEIKYITQAYETNWMSTVGENINEVERIAAEKAEKSRLDNERRAKEQEEKARREAEEAAKAFQNVKDVYAEEDDGSSNDDASNDDASNDGEVPH